jgi:hypothetical protein
MSAIWNQIRKNRPQDSDESGRPARCFSAAVASCVSKVASGASSCSQPQVRSVVCRELVALGEDKNGTYLDGVSLQVECRISIEAGEYSALGQPFATQFLYGYVGNLVVHQLRCAQCAGLQKCRSLLLLGFAEQCGCEYRRVYYEARPAVVSRCRLCHPEAGGNGRPYAGFRHCSATIPHGPNEGHRACSSLGKQLARPGNHLVDGDVVAGCGSG